MALLQFCKGLQFHIAPCYWKDYIALAA